MAAPEENPMLELSAHAVKNPKVAFDTICFATDQLAVQMVSLARLQMALSATPYLAATSQQKTCDSLAEVLTLLSQLSCQLQLTSDELVEPTRAQHVAALRADRRRLLIAYLSGSYLPPDLLPLDVDKLAREVYGSDWQRSLAGIKQAIEASGSAFQQKLVKFVEEVAATVLPTESQDATKQPQSPPPFSSN